MTKVLIPSMNMQDVLIESKYKDMITIIPVSSLKDVLDNILVAGPGKDGLLNNLANLLPKSNISGKVAKPIA